MFEEKFAEFLSKQMKEASGRRTRDVAARLDGNENFA